MSAGDAIGSSDNCCHTLWRVRQVWQSMIDALGVNDLRVSLVNGTHSFIQCEIADRLQCWCALMEDVFNDPQVDHCIEVNVCRLSGECCPITRFIRCSLVLLRRLRSFARRSWFPRAMKVVEMASVTSGSSKVH